MSKDVTPSGRVRNYAKENAWEDQPKQVKDRENRNKARAAFEKAGKVKKGDGKDVDHKSGNPRDNRPGNLQVLDRRRNQSKQ